ncbi:hypothetical protein [Brevibacterium casei]|nr:hypothetical protein [Brevibacterium casei]QPR39541.1 hypothetical protein I6G94_01200 [Brevibacterium casei]QPR43706.1 hypothetical protein I6G93_16490 [Brevibacterium casei]
MELIARPSHVHVDRFTRLKKHHPMSPRLPPGAGGNGSRDICQMPVHGDIERRSITHVRELMPMAKDPLFSFFIPAGFVVSLQNEKRLLPINPPEKPRDDSGHER